VNSR
jgi:hypothetical protein